MSFNLPQGDGKPKCYGESCNPKEVLCAGGADPTYNENGSHVRPPCDYYAPCRAIVAHKKLENDRLLPPASLVRTTTQQAQVTVGGQPVPQQMTPAQMEQYIQNQAKALATQMFNQAAQYQQYGRSSQQPVPQNFPMAWDPGFQPMPVNYRMPGFLSAPEAVASGGSIWGKLFREIFRSMGKAGGHSIAHFFDSTPIVWPPNGGNGQ